MGEKRIKINFVYKRSWVRPSVPGLSQYWFYHRTYSRYFYPTQASLTQKQPQITTTTSISPSSTYFSRTVTGLGTCATYRIYLNGAVVQDWTVLDSSNLATVILSNGQEIQLQSPVYGQLRRRYNSTINYVYIFAPIYPANYKIGTTTTIEIEFSTNPPGPNDWDNGDKVKTGFIVNFRKLPTITSYNYGWTWWYYYPRYYWGYPYRRVLRPWYPYTYYRPYGRTYWSRAYTFSMIPRSYPYTSYRVTGQFGARGGVPTRRY